MFRPRGTTRGARQIFLASIIAVASACQGGAASPTQPANNGAGPTRSPTTVASYTSPPAERPSGVSPSGLASELPTYVPPSLPPPSEPAQESSPIALPSGVPPMPSGRPGGTGTLWIQHSYTGSSSSDFAEQDYLIVVSVDLQADEYGAWVGTGGSWYLEGHGVNNKSVSDCYPDINEHYSLSGQGTFGAAGQSGTGGEGEGILQYARDLSPPLSIHLFAHEAFSDACTDLDRPYDFTFEWPVTCALEDSMATPCALTLEEGRPESASGWYPAAGATDLSGTLQKTVTGPNSLVIVTTDAVVGALGPVS